jgi:hypothetical protein
MVADEKSRTDGRRVGFVEAFDRLIQGNDAKGSRTIRMLSCEGILVMNHAGDLGFCLFFPPNAAGCPDLRQR